MKKHTNDKILAEAQAITLKGHGRKYVLTSFVHFDGDINQIAHWLTYYLKNKITSTLSQIEDTERYKQLKNHSSIPIIGFYISSAGFHKLEVINSSKTDFTTKNEALKGRLKNFLKTFQQETIIPFEDVAYWGDMYDEINQHLIKDPPPTKNWDESFLKDIHAMVLIADDSLERCKYITKELNKSMENGVGRVLFTEQGERMYSIMNNKRVEIEPFGYRDGITKINFFKKGKPYTLDENKWKNILDNHYGSYLVFRKLEQDVHLFNEKIEELADFLGISKDYAEAQVMGRYKDGTPLTIFKSPKKVFTEEDKNEIISFDNFYHDPKIPDPEIKSYYDLDAKGMKCPFHAHVRKVNPRKKFSLNDASSMPNPIVRRSVPYSKDGKTGLLFMCFQANITNQFLTIQDKWCNNEPSQMYDAAPQKGLDPIGRGENAQPKDTQVWNKKWKEKGRRYKKDYYEGNFDFSKKIKNENKEEIIKNIVTLRGGGFFYAPPISFFNDPLKKIISQNDT